MTLVLHPIIKGLARGHGLHLMKHLPYGKFLFRDESGQHLIKISASGRGARLIRNEIIGLEVMGPLLESWIRVPSVEPFIDSDGVVGFKCSFLAGREPSFLAAPKLKIGHHLQQHSTWVPLQKLLQSDGLDEAQSAIFMERFGNPKVRCAPSHGDFIYWNLICSKSDGLGLIDFEYFHPQRMAAYDDLFFRVGPWLYRCMRKNLPLVGIRHLLLHCAKKLVPSENPKLIAALFLSHWLQIARRLDADNEGDETGEIGRRIRAGLRLLETVTA
jgi:hypothetical protein